MAAVARDGVGVAGGWSSRPTMGHAFKAARFEFEGRRWVACQGIDRPGRASLLDATASFRAFAQTDGGVAILEPPSGKQHPPSMVTYSYGAQCRAAAWHGLGIVWTTSDEADIEGWRMTSPYSRAKAMPILDDLAHQILDAADRSWCKARTGQEAAEFINPIVHRALAARGYWQDACNFPGFWRDVKPTAAWARIDRTPALIAVEVSVDENRTAPFGKIVDELGFIEAVLDVRLLSHEATRRKLHDTEGMLEARSSLEAALPVKLLSIRFCALCEEPTPGANNGFPLRVCHVCDRDAVSKSGRAIDTLSMEDENENPIWIRGKKCWRVTRFGGSVSMYDPDDCPDIETYYKRYKGG
jgi:hypothetical protein